MKKIILLGILVTLSVTSLFSQSPQIGEDCITTDNQRGTYRNVTVTSSTSIRNDATATTNYSTGAHTNVGAEASAGIGGARVGVNANAGTSSSVGGSNSRGETTTTTQSISYEEVQCTPDNTNALPMSPAPENW